MLLSSSHLIPSFLERRKACFVWPYFGPQYYDRFLACKTYLSGLIDFSCIALSSVTSSYPFWDEAYKDIRYCSTEPWEKVSPIYLFDKVHDLLHEINPDVVFTHSYSTVDARSACIYALKNNKQLCIMTDSHSANYIRRWHVEFIKSWLIKGADSILLPGPIHSHYYRRSLGFKNYIFFGYNSLSPITLHQNLVETQSGATAQDTCFNKPYLFCAARPLHKKNIPNLCLAWEQSKASKSYDLLIAGGSQEDYKVSESHPSITFLGLLSPNHTLHRIAASSGCILPSISEQFGNFITEAVSFSKPILVSNRLGCLDLALRNPNSYIFDPYSIEEIVMAIDAWHSDVNISQPPASYNDKEFPLAVHVRDFAFSVYNIVFAYQRKRRFLRYISLILFFLLSKIYRKKAVVDVNIDT